MGQANLNYCFYTTAWNNPLCYYQQLLSISGRERGRKRGVPGFFEIRRLELEWIDLRLDSRFLFSSDRGSSPTTFQVDLSWLSEDETDKRTVAEKVNCYGMRIFLLFFLNLLVSRQAGVDPPLNLLSRELTFCPLGLRFYLSSPDNLNFFSFIAKRDW